MSLEAHRLTTQSVESPEVWSAFMFMLKARCAVSASLGEPRSAERCSEMHVGKGPEGRFSVVTHLLGE